MQTQKRNRQLRVLYLSPYYPPECNAPANRVSELARIWAREGYHVEILTGMPCHPHGVVPREYRGAWYRCEGHDGVIVHRGWIYPAANRGVIRRGLNYLSFMISAIIIGILKTGPTDRVIATSPHLFCAVAGWVVAIVKRAPFIFEVRDLWPAEIVAVGAITNRFVIRLIASLEMFLYRRATLIVAVANGTVEILTGRGVPPSRIVVIPNGVDTSTFVPGPRHNWVRDAYNLDGDLLISYIGTVGMAHRLDVILDAAECLHGDQHIRFLIVGDGAERSRLEGETRRRRLDSIIWVDQQPRERIAAYYQASDGCVVHLRRAELFTRNVPSKIYEIMAVGRPLLLGTEGESLQLGMQAGCAFAFAPESGADLARVIRELARTPDRGERQGQSGRRYVTHHYDRGKLARDYLDALCTLTAQSAPVRGPELARGDPVHAA